MKYLVKNNEQLRTPMFFVSKLWLIKILLSTLLITFSSCDDSINPLKPNVNLTITVEVPKEGDQIGRFARNAMALHDGKVWSIGGDNDLGGGIFLHNISWFSLNGANWEPTTQNDIGDERIGHTLTTFQNKLWLIGGENNAGDWLGDIWSSTDGMNWTNVFSTAPFGKVAHHDTIVFNGKMYVVAVNTTTGYMEVWSTQDGLNWVEETANAFPGRITHKAVVHNNTIYVIGGEKTANNKLNEIWQSTNGSIWSQVATNAPIFSERNHHTATAYNGKVWVLGGRTINGFGNDIWYSSNMKDWEKHSGLYVDDDNLHHHTALNYKDAIWIFGGYNKNGITGQIVSLKEN
ncbi:kelch repeat-containing protein [Flavivirga abyssicola]|uniref:Kelch repeat-containing protein n=1 Tax=Flavivirga abyssicola TaxID=3063533 RepID=UPI0026DF2E2C|nr:kelch repeat-containing protein [Flavivirga sp. MEBiC07777]WVK11690.1 kelch repeat-containing protein [Flavivirga sp. MEBiC07777]